MRPKRHIWEEGSTYRSVAGQEYDAVWNYVEELEAEIKRLREGIKLASRIDDRKFRWERTDELLRGGE